MDKKPKYAGRGFMFSQKPEGSSPGKSSEGASKVSTPPGVSSDLPSPVVDPEKKRSPKKARGRGLYLANVRKQQESESEVGKSVGATSESAVGLFQSQSNIEHLRRGRGLIMELARQANKATVGGEKPVVPPKEPESDVTKEMQELSLETEVEKRSRKEAEIEKRSRKEAEIEKRSRKEAEVEKRSRKEAEVEKRSRKEAEVEKRSRKKAEVEKRSREETEVERRGRAEPEEEKPPVIRRGEEGEKINIAVNYVTLKTEPEKGIFEYEVRFAPEVEYVAFRYKLINQHFKTNGGVRCYDGGDKLYMPEKLSSEKVIIDAKHPGDESVVQIVLTFKHKLRWKECSQLYNILINNCSKALNLTRLGKQHYDHSLGRTVPQHKLEVWPGYVTSVQEFEGGIHLCCDIRHRVLRTETAYNVIQNATKCDSRNFKALATRELLGQCVLTRYNNNLYRIDDIDWSRNPKSVFKLSSGEEITFLDYYKKQYNIQIKDLRQPLLINKPKRKFSEQQTLLICLIPELCNLTGLTDRMRKDMRVMKEIATYTRVTPAQRHLGFKKFLENIRKNERAQEMLRDWGLSLAEEPALLEGRLLPRENIILKQKAMVVAPSTVEWSKCLRINGVFRGTSIKYWLLIHTKKNTNMAYLFVNMLKRVCPGLGIEVCDPTFVSISDDKIDSYVGAIKENLTSKIQAVLCLCPTPREDRYAAIKKLCCRDLPIPSQIVNFPTISKETRMRAVVQNIALQLNNKLGGASWAIDIPLENTMICGIDTFHEPERGNISVGAFVASIDSEFTRWFSKTCIQHHHQELLDGLVFCFSMALQKYFDINKRLPERVIIFRDGVGDGQLSLVENHEVVQFLNACGLISKTYKPKFSFIVVQKRINTKIYQLSNGNRFMNPEPGCVLDHTVTRRNFYDFFLVSQFVACGTATPSHYIVLYDSSDLSPDIMQRVAYKCCHMYYNWAGTVRVPAPCQYAHKLAYLVGQSLKEIPKDVLDDKLYYL